MTESSPISKYVKYNMAHREERREYAKTWYQDHRDDLLTKTQCNICNSVVTKMHLLKHQQSLKCITCNNNNTTGGKIECDICRSRVTYHSLARHKLSVSCQRANTDNDNANLNTGKIPCDRCGKYILATNMKAHKLSKRCMNSRNKSNTPNADLLTCDVCGLKVLNSNMFHHKATVGCLTAYFSKVFERPFNKHDQMRYDYLIKKRTYFKTKNAERKNTKQCASNES